MFEGRGSQAATTGGGRHPRWPSSAARLRSPWLRGRRRMELEVAGPAAAPEVAASLRFAYRCAWSREHAFDTGVGQQRAGLLIRAPPPRSNIHLLAALQPSRRPAADVRPQSRVAARGVVVRLVLCSLAAVAGPCWRRRARAPGSTWGHPARSQTSTSTSCRCGALTTRASSTRHGTRSALRA